MPSPVKKSYSRRRARVRALAKINLDLRVLGKREDGFHELRTIFQTISLADTLDIAFIPGGRRSVELDDPSGIPDNLVSRAATMVLEALDVRGAVELALSKRIPMGAGLGGGSSDAAAILLALPVLAGRVPKLPTLLELAQRLGSDVPFFLMGGRAVGIGRGTELFPLPDGVNGPGLVVATGVHVSTAEAYRRLSSRLTTELQPNKIFNFQSQTWSGGVSSGENDFEAVVFEQHRSLATVKKRLIAAGAATAMMTGSGSAIFGLFSHRDEVTRAAEGFKKETTFRISLVNRARYRSRWWGALEEHISGRLWPPRSRYAR